MGQPTGGGARRPMSAGGQAGAASAAAYQEYLKKKQGGGAAPGAQPLAQAPGMPQAPMNKPGAGMIGQPVVDQIGGGGGMPPPGMGGPFASDSMGRFDPTGGAIPMTGMGGLQGMAMPAQLGDPNPMLASQAPGLNGQMNHYGGGFGPAGGQAPIQALGDPNPMTPPMQPWQSFNAPGGNMAPPQMGATQANNPPESKAPMGPTVQTRPAVRPSQPDSKPGQTKPAATPAASRAGRVAKARTKIGQAKQGMSSLVSKSLQR